MVFSLFPYFFLTLFEQDNYNPLLKVAQHYVLKRELSFIYFRFVSSKSGRLYLHTDIRVIFARQPPDLPSGVKFCTVTDGPTEPRYTQYNHKLV